MIKGVFKYRKSRRLAVVSIEGEIYDAYMSNGSDIDFLKPETVCYLKKVENEKRSTLFDLYSIYDGDTLVCIDAKEPINTVEKWYIENHKDDNIKSFIKDKTGLTLWACNNQDKDLFIQIMGTSLIKDKAAYLPVMASKSLNKRLENILDSTEQDVEWRLLIVICREDADLFCCNREKDPYFCHLLDLINSSGISIECLRCKVTEDGMIPDKLIPFDLDRII